jgi:hypothetical protein
VTNRKRRISALPNVSSCGGNPRKRKLGWIGHTLRKGDKEIPKAVLLWNPQGSRKRERRKNSWRRSVIKEAGRSWNELTLLAADRSGRNS